MSEGTGGFFDRREREDLVVGGRYRLSDPATGEDRSWTRASNYGHVIADHYGLTRWRHRQIVRGIRARADLQQLASVVDPDDGAKLDEVVDTALQVAGSNEQANRGTAIHEALALADRGMDYPEWAGPYVAGYRAELARHGLTVVLVERLVVNRDRESAGRVDRVYQTADGRFVVGDVKTTNHLDLTAGDIAVQLECYVGASHVLGDDGKTWGEFPVDRDQAVVVHVDRETGAASVYLLSMALARYGANLAMQVRGWHRMSRDLLLPYVRPADVPARVEPTVVSVKPFPQAEPDVRVHESIGLRGTDQRGNPRFTVDRESAGNLIDRPGDAARHLQAVPDDPGNEHSANSTTASLGDVLAPGTAHEDLMKLSKAELQRVLQSLDPGASVAHQRKILADKIVTLQSGGRVASSTPAATERHDPVAFSSPGAQAEAGPPTDVTAPTEDPDDPRSRAFRTVTLARVRSARTVGELGGFHQGLVRRYGDAAWTDEFTEAARERVAELDAATDGDSNQIVRLIAECETQKQLADLWESTTVGGSVPERWPAEVQAAANERLREIRSETPPPPSNPFAG